MTRKHFAAIANTIKTRLENVDSDTERLLIRDLANDLASELAGFNPNFNRSRFLSACGLDN